MTAESAKWALAAGVALAGWYALFALMLVATRARRPDAGAPSMEFPGDEPPALVNMLTNGWQPTRHAVSATVLDLAARDYLKIQHVGPGEFVVHLGNGDEAALTDYERQVLNHVRSLASDGQVPGKALTTGPQARANRWWRMFQRSVEQDAHRRGLARPRWHGPEVTAMVLLAAVPGFFIARFVVSLTFDSPSAWHQLFTIGAAATVFIATPLSIARDDRDTPAGLEAAGRWLGLRKHLDGDGSFADQPPGGVVIWGRYLAYGAAMGVADGALRDLPMGAESPYVAWSAYGGEWHSVRIRYPRLWPPGYGYKPWHAAALGLLGAGFTWFMFNAVSLPLAETFAEDEFMRPFAVVPLAAVGAPAVYFSIMFLYGFADMGRRRDVTGLVVRTRDVTARRNNNSTTVVRRYIAVDDGRSPEVKAFSGPLATTHDVDCGEVVRAKVAPRLGYIEQIATLPKDAPAAP